MEFTDKEKSLLGEAVMNFREDLLREQAHLEIIRVSALRSPQAAIVEDMLSTCDRILQKLDVKES